MACPQESIESMQCGCGKITYIDTETRIILLILIEGI